MRTTLAAIRTLEAIRRSKLAEFRTGMGVIAISLSILTVLISTSAFWNPSSVLFLLDVVGFLITFLLVVGVFFFYRGLRGMHNIDRQRDELAIDHEALEKIYNDILNDD